MAEKNLNARIIHKHDIEENWLKATSFIPKQGEIIVYDVDTNYNYERLKIGNGETNVNNLPFYACSWNDLTDVPFGGYGDVVLTWDRNIKNEECHIVTLNMGPDDSGHLHKRGYYYVSNLIPSNEVLVEGYNITFGSYEYPFNYNKWFETENEISSFNDDYTSVCNDIIVVVKKDNTAIVTIDGTVTFPKSGIYFFYEEMRSSYDEFSWYISELKFKSEVKTLDEHLIPSTIARVNDVEEVRALVGDTAVSDQISAAISAHGHNYYGVCTTAADTAAKTVEIDGFELNIGAMVIVKFDNANSASNPTLNVSGTGAKPMYRYGTTAISTGTTTTGWYADSVQMFVYDGTGWIRDYWNNTTYSNAGLGHGYTTCSTAAATLAKTAALSSYALTTGGSITVKFENDVPANSTLNIASKGAKAIYYRGSAITDGVIKAGDTATFVYSTYYHLITIDKQQDVEAITNEEIDRICGGAISYAEDVMF